MNINDEDIWADIDAIYNLSKREPTDIDATQISKRYNVCMNAARERMNKMVASGNYYFETVIDTTCPNGKRKVIRKVTK